MKTQAIGRRSLPTLQQTKNCSSYLHVPPADNFLKLFSHHPPSHKRETNAHKISFISLKRKIKLISLFSVCKLLR